MRADRIAHVAQAVVVQGCQRGRQLGIIGTPNFFIENRLVKRALGMKEIREMVDPLLATR